MANTPGFQKIIVSHDEYAVHDSRAVTVSYSTIDLTGASTLEFAFRTGTNGTKHMKMNLGASGNALYKMFEGSSLTLTAAITPYNLDRGSTETFSITAGITASPGSVTTTSTLIDTAYLPGGLGTPGRPSLFANADAEWILKTSTTYYVTVANQTANTITVSWEAIFVSE